MPDKEIVSQNGRHLPHGFPDDVVQRGLELMLESGSIHLAQIQLEREMVSRDDKAVVPAWSTLCEWARAHKDVISHIQRDRKRDMIALGYDASMASGQRMLKVIPNLPDSQMAVPHGIIWDKQIALVKEGTGPIQAVQINLVGADGKRIGEV